MCESYYTSFLFIDLKTSKLTSLNTIKLKRIVKPGPNNQLIGEKGEILYPPEGWVFLPAGDAAITRKITAKGEFWRVQIKKGRRLISKGIWAPSAIIEQALRDVVETRSTEAYKKKRLSDLKRRKQKEETYSMDFLGAIVHYLNFHPEHKSFETKLAEAVNKHAIPVGSGTVARTAMIPIEERAAKAVIAWMRHQTTAYEQTKVAHIKGERRALRRQFAQQSVRLLNKYRSGENIPELCPLKKALLKKI